MPQIPRLLVTFAVREEAAPFRKRLPTGSKVEILLTGIGPNQAQIALLKRFQEPNLQPTLVISAGFAGGLDPSLVSGDIVYDCSAASHLEPRLLEIGAKPARFHGSTAVLLTPEAKRQARQNTGGDVVDMESVVIARICQDRSVACAKVRAVSDPADQALPVDFNRCIRPDGRLRWRPLIAECLQRPRALSGLIQLRKSSAIAADRLANVLLHLTP